MTYDLQGMPGRMRCCVPGCGRTFKDEGHLEIMCGKHWRLADRRLRRLLTRVRRAARRRGWNRQLYLLDKRIWAKARDQAIERALGL